MSIVTDEMVKAAQGSIAAHRLWYKTHDGRWELHGRQWVDGEPDPQLVKEMIEPGADRWRLEYAYKGPSWQGEAVAWSAEDAFEQYLAAEIDNAPDALRRLGEWLADRLDEDYFPTANSMLLGAVMETNAAIRAAERVGVPDGLLQLIRDARHRICNDAPSGLGKKPFDHPVYGPLLRRLDDAAAMLAAKEAGK